MKINTEELEETIIPVKETDLIYGIDDRPPLKETLFAAFISHFCRNHYSAFDYCGGIEAGSRNNRFFGVDGSFCFRCVDLHTM